MQLESTTLDGKFVRLEPLSINHREGLCNAIYDGELWNLHVTRVPHPDELDNFFNYAKKEYESGISLPFAIIDKSTNTVAGSTRFMKAETNHKRIEIGYTFLGKSWQKTRINTEAKYLMLLHEFEILEIKRLELITDYLNNSSRQAILRLGAKEEGILRNHMTMSDGRVRDSVIYSIIESEWPGVKKHLSYKLA